MLVCWRVTLMCVCLCVSLCVCAEGGPLLVRHRRSRFLSESTTGGKNVSMGQVSVTVFGLKLWVCDHEYKHDKHKTEKKSLKMCEKKEKKRNSKSYDYFKWTGSSPVSKINPNIIECEHSIEGRVEAVTAPDWIKSCFEHWKNVF